MQDNHDYLSRRAFLGALASAGAAAKHIFAQQKDRVKRVIRSIGLGRADVTIIMANIAYNMRRWRWSEG